MNTPMHVVGTLDLTNGTIATLITSFDVWHHHLCFIEIYRTEGSLSVPDPNAFGGLVRLHRAPQFQETTATFF